MVLELIHWTWVDSSLTITKPMYVCMCLIVMFVSYNVTSVFQTTCLSI